ncbi:MAG: aldo/keto reductase [Methanothrix sp.]|nr:aldo/keto reductase [Methanothrix sp.]
MGLKSLDLWQIHDLRTRQDIEEMEGSGGALRAFMEAKDAGLVRYLGVTGHHAPRILEHAVKSWPVDSVLMPINPAEAVLGGFLDRVMAVAKDRGLAIIGMKVLGGSHYISPEDGVTAELLLRFALSQEISTAIVGCRSAGEVQALAQVGREFHPLAAVGGEKAAGAVPAPGQETGVLPGSDLAGKALGQASRSEVIMYENAAGRGCVANPGFSRPGISCSGQ